MSYNFNTPGCGTGCNLDGTPCATVNQEHIPCASDDSCTVGNNQTYKPQDFLTPLAGQIVPMVRVFKQGHSTLLKFFFDYESVTDKVVDPKAVFKNFNDVKMGSFYDGGYFTWGERYYKPTEFKVAVDYTADTRTIQVGVITGVDANGDPIITPQLGDQNSPDVVLKVNDTVLIYRTTEDACCTEMLTKTIAGVDGATNSITIEPGFTGDAGFTFKKGDKIKFMYSGRNDCCPIVNKFPDNPSVAKRGYLQHFGYEISFNKCEINKAYASPLGAMTSVQNKLFNASLRMTREMGFAGYWGRNRGSLCCGCDKLPGELQGLLSGMFDSDARNPGLGIVSSVHRAKSNKDIVKWIFSEILKAQNSGGVMRGEGLTLLMNEVAASAFLTRGGEWDKIRGVQVQVSDVNNKSFDFQSISTPAGKVDIMTDTLLSEIYENEGVIAIIPLKHLSMTARPNFRYNPMTNKIESSQPGFKMEEIVDSKNHECKSYDVFTELGTMIKAMDSGAFRFITGIRGFH